jgi:hypothetical protein
MHCPRVRNYFGGIEASFSMPGSLTLALLMNIPPRWFANPIELRRQLDVRCKAHWLQHAERIFSPNTRSHAKAARTQTGGDGVA